MTLLEATVVVVVDFVAVAVDIVVNVVVNVVVVPLFVVTDNICIYLSSIKVKRRLLKATVD